MFKKLWYDELSNSSLVECKPITGRTHQIRVHISSLGHPILNDVQYGGPFVGNHIIKIKFPDIFAKEDHAISDEPTLKKIEEEDVSLAAVKAVEAVEEVETVKAVEAVEDTVERITKKLKTNSEEGLVIKDPVNLLSSSEGETAGSCEIKLFEEKGVYRLEGALIENHSWCYRTQPMEICLHSI